MRSKREIFKALTELYWDHVPQWNKSDRTVPCEQEGQRGLTVFIDRRQKNVSFMSNSLI